MDRLLFIVANMYHRSPVPSFGHAVPAIADVLLDALVLLAHKVNQVVKRAPPAEQLRVSSQLIVAAQLVRLRRTLDRKRRTDRRRLLAEDQGAG
ncbi:MAG TPA: hypothetical protein VLZ50_15070 [Terracidiphilus sp.]|nr:hypothetical protein [Terracidiphilus sp.]